ncbi:hypothetical protein CCR75_003471 [Bremia lactucae]|uniref:NAD-dependent epimerase/dehydratase domain-containing protein n=1 Tax=Bremia lactucae TaxID=4779 RepID=A0A976FKV8_BRELC|nr:hypothetical protein CCR75_003471 [Bremia lactucae]
MSCSNKLFVFGLGYSATRAARAFRSAGYLVSGTVRSVDAATRVSRSNADFLHFEDSKNSNVFLFDGDQWSRRNALTLEDALKGVTHVLISVPPRPLDGYEDPVMSALGNRLILATKDTVQWVGYLSTIGVYGETNGITVDESAPVHSSVKRSQLRIKAERLWLDSGLPAHIFRIAGIYGPKRGTITRVRNGTASRIHFPDRKFNRIHVDDIVNILLASAAQPRSGGIYNVCDDEPAPSDEVTAYACELLEVAVPSSQSWEEAGINMSAMAKSFYAESRLCANRRIKDELGVTLMYPTYREGFLAQVLEEDKLAKKELKEPICIDYALHSSINRRIILINSGCLHAKPYLDLCRIGFRLSRVLGQLVVPCSFQYSDEVDPQVLYGLQAKTFEMVLTEFLATRGNHAREVIILPLFFGTCATLTDFLPTTINKVWAASTPPAPLSIRISGCLVESASDTRVSQILLEGINQVVNFGTIKENVTVLVVGEGSPNCTAYESREFVVQALRRLLKTQQHVKLIETACMECRQEAEYEFNDPPLAVAFDRYAVKQGIVVVAKLFFSNGHNAGEKDNFQEIIENVRLNKPNVDIRVTQALGTHELLTEILQDRYSSIMSKEFADLTLNALE